VPSAPPSQCAKIGALSLSAPIHFRPPARARALALPVRPRAGDKIELDVELGSESSDLLQQMAEGAAMARGK
jgi:hypothetical protein